MQQVRFPRIRSLWYTAAGLVLAIAVLVAVLLPHSSGPYFSSGLFPPPVARVGVGVWPRVGIAIAGIAGAGLLVLLPRRFGSRAPKQR